MLRDKLQIDKNSLDDELIGQLQSYLEASDAYAEALSKRDLKKEELAQMEAELMLMIRKEADAEGKKVTEAIIQAKVQENPGREVHFKHYLEAKELAEKALGLKDAFSQRAFALKSLADLMIAGYFTTSAVRGQKAEEVVSHSRRATLNKERNRLRGGE